MCGCRVLTLVHRVRGIGGIPVTGVSHLAAGCGFRVVGAESGMQLAE
jgi:hypothetical protein